MLDKHRKVVDVVPLPGGARVSELFTCKDVSDSSVVFSARFFTLSRPHRKKCACTNRMIQTGTGARYLPPVGTGTGVPSSPLKPCTLFLSTFVSTHRFFYTTYEYKAVKKYPESAVCTPYASYQTVRVPIPAVQHRMVRPQPSLCAK